ncbi:DUF551 domain-containing protein [Salmonella enterica subsp. diarizonae]|nr:DUF551 domain-containing protein [Salmonella enterica subsp. diarizonae]
MSNIDKQALREEFRYMQDHYSDPADRERQEIYIAAEALLDELDKKQQYIKLRDQENYDIALTVGKLRVELEGKDAKIANLTAERDALREGEMGDAKHSNTRAASSPVIPDGWISCSERMPEDEQEVIVHNKLGYRYVSYFDEHSGLFFDMRGGNQMNCIEHLLVTHWMPLPAAPEPEQS